MISNVHYDLQPSVLHTVTLKVVLQSFNHFNMKKSSAALVNPIAQLPVEHKLRAMTDRNYRAGGGRWGIKYRDFSTNSTV